MLQAIDTFYLSWKICETCKCKYMLMTWSAFCGGSTKRIFDGWILRTGKSRTIIEYIHEYKQLQFKLLINTKNRYLVHICFDVCNVYKKLHWWRSLQSITFVLCAPEKKLGTKCLFIKFSKGSNSLARYLIRFMS